MQTSRDYNLGIYIVTEPTLQAGQGCGAYVLRQVREIMVKIRELRIVRHSSDPEHAITS